MEQIYASESPLQVLLITGLIGGGAAWLAGRAIAHTWRPFWHVIGYMALLGCAVRFVHFALFEADLIAPLSYAADTVFLLCVGCLGWRITRTTQMVTQYSWLYERTSPVTWRDRAAMEEAAGKGSVTRVTFPEIAPQWRPDQFSPPSRRYGRRRNHPLKGENSMKNLRLAALALGAGLALTGAAWGQDLTVGVA